MFTRLSELVAGTRRSTVRLRRRGRGAGHGRRAPAVLRDARRGSSERALLRRRSRAAHLPAAVLVARARRRHPRPLEDATGQLPNVTPDPAGSGSAARSGADRRRRQWSRVARDTVSVFNGTPPTIRVLDDEEAEVEAVAEWIGELSRRRSRCRSELGVFVRSEAELERATRAVEAAGLPFVVLDETCRAGPGAVSREHDAPGQGPRVPGRRRDGLRRRGDPARRRASTAIADSADLEDVYKTERHLLYVACTRARDHLLVTGVAPGSEFLEDLG